MFRHAGILREGKVSKNKYRTYFPVAQTTEIIILEGIHRS